jgi:hypothetical protein
MRHLVGCRPSSQFVWIMPLEVLDVFLYVVYPSLSVSIPSLYIIVQKPITMNKNIKTKQILNIF